MRREDLAIDIGGAYFSLILGSLQSGFINFCEGLGTENPINIYDLHGPYWLTRDLYRQGTRIWPIVTGVYDTVPGLPAYLLGRGLRPLYERFIHK